MGRLRTLFGDDVLPYLDDLEPTNSDSFLDIVERFEPELVSQGPADAGQAVCAMVLNQVVSDDPPEVWAAVERMLELGLSPSQAVRQVAMELGHWMIEGLAGDGVFDHDLYFAGLDSLPLPSGDELEQSLVDAARAAPGVAMRTLLDGVVGSAENSMRGRLVSQLFERLLGDTLTMLYPDRIFSPQSLVDQLTLTHRLTDVEAELGVLVVVVDLGAFSWFDEVRLDDGTELDQLSAEPGHLAWRGPDGWLGAYAPGDLLAVTLRADPANNDIEARQAAAVTIERAGHEPVITTELVGAVKAAYDVEVAEPWLPVDTESLLFTLLLDRPDFFEQLLPPIGDVCDELGLTRKGRYVGHEASLWRRARNVERAEHIDVETDDPDLARMLRRAVESLTDPDASVEDIRSALSECATDEAIDILADVLIDRPVDIELGLDDDDVDAPAQFFARIERADNAARRPQEKATANFLAGVLHERSGDPHEAERRFARADQEYPRIGAVVERLGWYRFDRGDARGAQAAWGQLSEGHPALTTIAPFLNPSTGQAKVGRNDPCWCGSGRKFKQCHQGAPDVPALPDRVPWILRKLSLWTEHLVGDDRALLTDCALAWASGQPEPDGSALIDLSLEAQSRLLHAFEDPILIDAALHEGGMMHQFLRERGPLLPDDEQLLLASWMAIERSVHKIVAVEPGLSITFRDLATGDKTEVTERSASQTARVGDRWCARLLPDGVGHQIVGGVVPVRAGDEGTVLDLCDLGDPLELCAWAGASSMAPTVELKPGLLDETFGTDTLQSVIDSVPQDGTDEENMAAIQEALRAHMQMAWLDLDVPALGGLTPRQAAVDPTRREDLERLLDEFDQRPAAGELAMTYDVAVLRRELGLHP